MIAPPGPVLTGEHGAGKPSPFGRLIVTAGGQRDPCGDQHELGLLGRGRPAVQGRLDPGQGVGGQPGREQHRTAVQRRVGHEYAEPGVAAGCVVQVAQRPGQVTGGKCDQAQVVPSIGDLQLLAGSGEQPLGRGQARAGCLDGTHSQVGQGGGGQRPGLPDDLTGLTGQRDGLAQVGPGLRVPAGDVQRAAAADQDTAQRPGPGTGRRPGLVQDGQPRLGAARHDQGGAERGEHVCFPLGIMRCPGQPGGEPEFADGRGHVAEVAQHDRGRLVGDRRLALTGPAGQHRAGRGQRGSRADSGQRDQLVGRQLAGPGLPDTGLPDTGLPDTGLPDAGAEAAGRRFPGANGVIAGPQFRPLTGW